MRIFIASILITISFFLSTVCFAAGEVHFVREAYNRMSKVRLIDIEREPGKVRSSIADLFHFTKLFELCAMDFVDRLDAHDRDQVERVFSRMIALGATKNAKRIADKKLRHVRFVLKEPEGDKAHVEVVGNANGKDVHLDFWLSKLEGGWRLADLAVDGVLLSRNYRGQFNKIHRKEGCAGLISRIRKKLT
jgi:ABC-type transporter MlaC component